MADEELDDIFTGEEIQVDSTFGSTDGASGTSGSNGIDGSDGSDGSNGSSGSSGSNGSNGSNGSDGSNGSNGSSGSDGSDGSDGSNGSNGSSGSDGSDGSNGSNGSSGSDGSNGSDGEEKELIECKSYTFLAELIPESQYSDDPRQMFKAKWYFPKYVYSESIQTLLGWFIRGIMKMEGKWCFTSEFIDDNYSGTPEDKYLELIDIDAKVLKYIILSLKNNPTYFKPDGYQYYFYDTLSNIFKTIISSKEIGLGAYSNEGVVGYPISDNEIQLFDGGFQNGCLITLENGYLDISNEYAGIKYLGSLKSEWDEIIQTQGKFINDLGQTAINKSFDKMVGFVRIVEQILEH